MTENTIKTRIVLRNDKQSAWNESTKTLLKGEVAVSYVGDGKAEIRFGELDGTKTYKDGVKLQISADQVVGLNESISELSVTDYAFITDINPQTATADEIMAEFTSKTSKTAENLNAGDTLILKELIADKKYDYETQTYSQTSSYQHAAYVWNGTAWAAMDGTYNADSVYFDENLKYTVALGTLSKPMTYSTLSSKGMSLEDLMKTLMSKEVQSTVTKPTFTFSTTDGSGEVGTTFTRPAATLKMTSIGSYTYGPATGVTVPAASAEISCSDGSTTSNTTAMAKDNTLTLSAGTAGAETYTDEAQTFTYKCSATYTDGVGSKSNLENISTTNIVKSDTFTDTKTATFTGYRKMFYGTKTSTNMIAAQSNGKFVDDYKMTSAEVRDLGNSNNGEKTYTETSTWTIPAGTQQIIFAIPKSYNVSGLTVNDVTKPTGKFEIAFNEQTAADVYGATTSTTTAEYKIFAATFGIPYAAAGKLTVAYK